MQVASYSFARDNYKYDYSMLMEEVHFQVKKFFGECLDDCEMSVSVIDTEEGISVHVIVSLPDEDEEDDSEDGDNNGPDDNGWGGVDPDAPDPHGAYNNSDVIAQLNSEMSQL